MNLATLLDYRIPSREQAYEPRDAMLYALGVGLGQDPMDATQLAYVYEGSEGGLQVLPSFAMTLAHPGFWLKDPALGVDWVHLLHTEQHLQVARPLPAAGRVRADYRVTGLADRGPERGVTLYFEKRLTDVATGDELARVVSGVLCRKDGGCGHHGEVPAALAEVPARAPDARLPWRVAPNAALVYRLSGDMNPVHADPGVAAKAGFERPLLHGLCTMGVAAQVLARHLGGPEHVRDMACRFTRPVLPGDELEVQVWHAGAAAGEGGVRFEVMDTASGKPVLGRGTLGG